jgi:hypothetical protein
MKLYRALKKRVTGFNEQKFPVSYVQNPMPAKI